MATIGRRIGMCRLWPTRRTFGALAWGLAIVALLITPGTAGAVATETQARPCVSWTSTVPPSPGTMDNELFGVAALSACNVWAVGIYRNDNRQLLSLAEHWNGTSWKVVSTPNPGTTINFLRAVSAYSPSNVWAVGNTESGPLILHWNGNKWLHVGSPSTGSLSGVDAASATSTWAVGNSAGHKALILHWNGKKWSRVASPSPGTGSLLDAVTATSPSSAWAVGAFNSGTASKTLILHWTGKRWERAVSPNPSGTVTEVDLQGVAATSGSNVWAVGAYNTDTSQKTIIVHWNGRVWRQASSPSPGPEPDLFGVAATSADSAWAVGWYKAGSADKTLIEHWNGRAWKQMASPNPGIGGILSSVAATSASNVWAVGNFSTGGPTKVFAIHCC